MVKRIVKDIFAAVGVITVCKAFCDNYEVKRKSDADDIIVPLASTSWKSVTYADRDEAEQILSELKEAIEKWHYVSVADACDLAGVPSNYSDTKSVGKILTARLSERLKRKSQRVAPPILAERKKS